MAASTIPTRVLILSDTHGAPLPPPQIEDELDVVVHCGDLTEESKLKEFRSSIDLLKNIKADLKLVVAGNHDWTLGDAVFRTKVAEMRPSVQDLELVEKTYGRVGDARRLLESEEAKAAGIVFLDEGTHTFALANGARLTVYASPYTPSLNKWAFNYDPREGHIWDIGQVDVAITHSPPMGILDYTSSRQRTGTPGLFAAIARARPLMHCFGHIHEAWGAKDVAWIADEACEEPSHFTDIDNDASEVVESLAGLRPGKFDDEERVAAKEAKRGEIRGREYCVASGPGPEKRGQRTLFVNAAIEGEAEGQRQWPWAVDLQLPRAKAAD